MAESGAGAGTSNHPVARHAVVARAFVPHRSCRGANGASSRAWVLAAVVLLSSFRRTLTPALSRRERELKATAGSPAALQHASLDLVALDALEQGLEVAFAEAFVALALADPGEDLAEI